MSAVSTIVFYERLMVEYRSVLVYAIPNGGTSALVWGVRAYLPSLILDKPNPPVGDKQFFSHFHRSGDGRARLRNANFRRIILLGIRVLFATLATLHILDCWM